MVDMRYAIISGALSPSLIRLVAEAEEVEAKLRVVGGDDYDDLAEEVERRWNRSCGFSVESRHPAPSRARIASDVIGDYARTGSVPRGDR